MGMPYSLGFGVPPAGQPVTTAKNSPNSANPAKNRTSIFIVNTSIFKDSLSLSPVNEASELANGLSVHGIP